MSSPPIEPVYWQEKPNDPIVLGDVAVQFKIGDKQRTCSANVSMRFTPDERLCFVVPPDEHAPLLGLGPGFGDNWDGKVGLTERGVMMDALCTRASTENGLTFIPRQSPFSARPPSDGIAQAVFHLFNFPEFWGSEDYALESADGTHQVWTRCGRVILRSAGWSATIAATDKSGSACRELKEQGGYIITHMGSISRDDGSVFSNAQLTEVLAHVYWFLSFALGRRAGVAFAVGVDGGGERVFEQWGMPRSSAGPRNGSTSWFDSQHAGALSDVFPGFCSAWDNPLWAKPLRVALYWYLSANERGSEIGVDAALILAQVALEQLAWTYCVRDRKMVSERAFGRKGLSAADKLRLLLSALGIPAALPAELTALQGRPGKKWEDGPDAIAGIRNALVHPLEKDDLPARSYFEAWNLAMWFLDLVLLRLCHFDGHYANRLKTSRWAGQVEPVPWAKSSALEP